MAIVTVGLGFMTLIAGRPVYYVFTGAIGYLTAVYLFTKVFHLPASWPPLAALLALAAIFAGITQLGKRWWAACCGGLAGAYLVMEIPRVLGSSPAWSQNPLVMGLVGVACIVLMLAVFEIGAVLVSALTATTMILQYLRTPSITPPALFVILMVFSLIIQFLLTQYGRSLPD
ncbi:MAG: hypothetical protein ACKOC5_00370 [Chloroflexota bacterium]